MTTVNELGPRLGIAPTCAALGLPRATYYRRRRPQRVPAARPRSSRSLSPGEQATVLARLHEPRFVDLAPAEVYATLLDDGEYLCSERTMYRVLAAHHEVRERRDQLRHPRYAAPRTAGPAAQRTLELGHHEVAGAGEVDLLLPVRHARRLQPLRGRLDGDPWRERHARRAVHPRDVRSAGHRARSPHDSRRPRPSDDLEVRGV